MSLDKYKNIPIEGKLDETRAERIRQKDLDLFQRGSIPTIFGSIDDDNIEFSLYDLSGNLLGWTINNNPPKIIDSGEMQVSGSYKEMVLEPKVDIGRLGYNKGNFKVSYQFLHNRVGSNKKGEKVFIKEISPSRTEVRILPVFTGNDQQDEEIRNDFDHFKTNDLRKTDIYYIVDTILSGVTIDDIKSVLKPQFIVNYRREFQATGERLDNLLKRVLEISGDRFRTNLVEEDDKYVSRDRLLSLYIETVRDVLEEEVPNVLRRRFE